jgi:hypothetical protein
MLWRRITIAGTAAMLVLSAACGGGSASTTGGTPLLQALSRVAATTDDRAQIYYDDTAALVKLAGRNVTGSDGFGVLRGFGSGELQELAGTADDQPGIMLFNADYSISAGLPPHQLGLVAGGQQPDTITRNLTKIGWQQHGSTLVGPSPSQVGTDANLDTTTLALSLARVHATGSDLAYGGPSANLDQIGSPSGATLVQDPVIDAVASCLGDVVAAEIVAPYRGGRNPAAVAVGLRQPQSNTAVPHAVVCVSWGNATDAGRYATAAQQALATGTSPRTLTRYSTMLQQPSVRNLGGSANVVSWEANVPGDAQRVFVMTDSVDLPALPDCQQLDRLSPAARQAARVPCS